MGLPANVTYFAKGGGCFLEGTLVTTPNGKVAIETLKEGDEVISYNEKTGLQEVSKIGSIDILSRESYYIINNSIKVTGEHPFYTNRGIEQVKNFDNAHRLINFDGEEVQILSYTRVDENVTVYNLLNVEPNNNYYANDFLVHNKGGGCFLKGTKVRTPFGEKAIDKLKVGDHVISNSDDTHRDETSIIGAIDVLTQPGYFILNGELKVTATHPMYVAYDDIRTLVRVQDLMIGNELITDAGTKLLTKIEYVQKEVTVYNLINVAPNHNYYANNYLVHNKGGGGGHASSGGHSSSSGRSSSSSSSSSGKSTSSSTGKAPSTSANKSANSSSSRSTTSATTKPGSKVVANGKEVTTSTKKPSTVQGKPSTQAGVTGVDGYSPRFTNGYAPPAGSTVYYPQHSALDYLPWIYLFSQNSPQNDQTIIVQPDGKEVQAQPVKEGVDGLAVFNWILLIVIVIAIVGGIVWGVNKLTNKDSY